MNIGSVIEQKRKERKLTQTELAQKLGFAGEKTSQNMICKWEKGQVVPNANQFLALCKVLEISDVMGDFLGLRTDIFSGLNKEGRSRVAEYVRLLRNDSRFCVREAEAYHGRLIRLYDLPASAGPGTFLDGESFELIELPQDAPQNAGYALRVSGKSMEPYYHNGQIVWVKEQNSLMPGEIGIFLYDGCSYIKQLTITYDGVVLHSLNPESPDVPVRDTLPLRVMGKLLA